MERRNFLQMLGAAVAVPVVPGSTMRAVASGAGYNRYMYGLAVFHARTRGSLTAADLATKLRVGSTTAHAILGEMSASRVISPALGSSSVMQAASRIHDPLLDKRAISQSLRDWALSPEVDATVTEDDVSQNEQSPRPVIPGAA